LSKANFSRLFHRLVDEAGLPQMRPYDTRHSAASMWLTAGASIVAVSARLGHKKPDITLRFYAHCMPSEQATLAKLASTLLSPQKQGVSTPPGAAANL
jgi:integrase